MAVWTDIPDSALEPGKPIRSVDGIALRENPKALAEGASGAPKIQADALDTNSVTTTKIANANVTAAKLATGSSEDSWVGARTSGLSTGALGTYAFLKHVPGSNTSPGTNRAGSNLRYSSAGGDENGTPSGTWKCMGTTVSSSVTLWLRVA